MKVCETTTLNMHINSEPRILVIGPHAYIYARIIWIEVRHKDPTSMEFDTGKRLKSLIAFLRANFRRIIIITAAALVAQLAGVPIPNGVYPSDYLYPASFFPLIFIAGGGGLVGLVGYSIGATAGDLIRFGLSLTLILFDLFAFGFAGWFTGVALKNRTGIGQVILTLIATTIGGVVVVFLSAIGANVGRGFPYNTLYSRYLFGWLPFFIFPAAILSYWMKRVRAEVSKFAEISQEKKTTEGS